MPLKSSTRRDHCTFKRVRKIRKMDKKDGVLPKHTKAALWTAFVNLKPNKQGEVPKTQLQRVCAYVATSVQRFHQEKQLRGYIPQRESLTFEEFLRYVQSYIVKPNDRANFEIVEEFCWRTFFRAKFQKTVQQWTRLGPSEEAAFKLWRIFNCLSIEHTISPVEAFCIIDKLNKTLHGSSSVPLFSGDSESDSSAFCQRCNYWHLLNNVVDSFPSRIDQDSILQAVEQLEDEIVRCYMKQGMLLKKGHVRHNWKERWFVLTPGMLKYYSNESKTCLKGVIYVRGNCQVGRVEGKSNYPNRLSLTCSDSGKVFEIASPSFEAIESWISILRFAATSDTRTLFELSVIERQKKLSLKGSSASPDSARFKDTIEKYDAISRKLSSRRFEKKRSEMQQRLGSDSSKTNGEYYNRYTTSSLHHMLAPPKRDG